MSRIKEILRLKNMAGLSLCAIGRSVSCSHNTVKDILRRADEKELTWEIAETLSDTDLEQRIYGEKKATVVPRPEPDLAFIDQELRRPGVNLSLLWHEYKLSNPNGVQYTQFCERYRKWAGTRQLSLHILHKAGEKLFVDWAGDTMTVIDPSTGEIISGYLFVCSLGRSGYPYAEAFPTKEKEHWIAAHRNAFEYYRGVPLILVPDNDKSAVTRADKYDPEINKTYRPRNGPALQRRCRSGPRPKTQRQTQGGKERERLGDLGDGGAAQHNVLLVCRTQRRHSAKTGRVLE